MHKTLLLIPCLTVAALLLGAEQWRSPQQASGAEGALYARNFGAACNGVADDTAEIQAALNAALGAWAGGPGAKKVYIPPSTCMISDTLRMGSGTTLIGESWQSEIRASPTFSTKGTPAPALVAIGGEHFGGHAVGTRAQYSMIRDLTLNANKRAVIGVRLDGVEQGSGLRSVQINEFGTNGLYGIVADADDGDGFADFVMNDLNIWWSRGQPPPAGARGILLDGNGGMSPPLEFHNITVNGWSGANADSAGIEIADMQGLVITNITGEMWGDACILFNSVGQTNVAGVRCGNGAQRAVHLTGIGGMNNIFMNVLAAGAGIETIQDDQTGYVGFSNSVENIYIQGGYDSAPFIRTNGSTVKWGKTDTPPICNDAAIEGAMYFDDTINTLCYCDGTNWRAVDDDFAGADVPGVAHCH